MSDRIKAIFDKYEDAVVDWCAGKLTGGEYKKARQKAITEVNDLELDKPLANTDTANPPNPTSINEILEDLVHTGTCGVWQNGYLNIANPCNCYIKDLKTALYTLIASVRPKNKKDYDGNDLNSASAYYSCAFESWSEVIRLENGYDLALQDYDNAIKELFHE